MAFGNEAVRLIKDDASRQRLSLPGPEVSLVRVLAWIAYFGFRLSLQEPWWAVGEYVAIFR